jgi:hypothetical protein
MATLPARRKLPKWQTGRDTNAEARVHASVKEYIEAVAPQCFVFHVPNGGPGRSLSRLKWLGAVSGITDLVIIDEHGLAYFLEIKTVDGVLSDAQKDFRDMCRRKKYPWWLARSVNDARDALEAWGIQTREAKR